MWTVLAAAARGWKIGFASSALVWLIIVVGQGVLAHSGLREGERF